MTGREKTATKLLAAMIRRMPDAPTAINAEYYAVLAVKYTDALYKELYKNK